MIYKEFQGKKLSALGLGCMRLPVKDDAIDEAATAQIVDVAIKNGINYFDTAWGYHNGQSEPVMGKILSKYPRESFYLATKFPGYSSANLGHADEIFAKQLERCCVDYFDFYLIHNVCEANIDGYLDEEKYGDVSYFIEQKKNGRIKHLGFSVHGNLDTTKRFLKAYGEHMEFCQVQLNYLDWSLQNAKAKVELLNEYNIPVWVMEGVRGGKLAKIDDKYADILKALRPDETVPGWAFRFLQTIPSVTVTLSGMSNLTQLEENIKTFCEEKPLTKDEWNELAKIADSMLGKNILQCTSCRYCTTHCPQDLNIPWLIEVYNELTYSGGGFIPSMAIETLPEDKRPSACIGCRSCEEVCPQVIKISEMMSDFAEKAKSLKD